MFVVKCLTKVFECPICLGMFRLKDTIETDCHRLCYDCFFNKLGKSDKRCALCRTPKDKWNDSLYVSSCHEVG